MSVKYEERPIFWVLNFPGIPKNPGCFLKITFKTFVMLIHLQIVRISCSQLTGDSLDNNLNKDSTF